MKACIMGAFALMVSFAAGSVMVFAAQKRASANSAPAYWDGADATGVLLAGDECPIAVEKELLTLNIPEFPPLDGEEEGFEGYGANVTAQYTFRNPTESDVTATLLFPFGYIPTYAPCDDFYDDTARYAVKENGQNVGVNTRHSYGHRRFGTDFDVEKEIESLEGEGESFFTADTPVTEHVFHVTVPEADESGRGVFLTLSCAVKADPAKTRIAASGYANMFVEKGVALVTYGFEQKRGDFDFSLYVFGEDATVKKKGVYDYHAEETIEGAAVEETETTTGTYAAFASERYPGEESGISEEDWVRGFTAALGSNLNYDMLCTMPPDEISAADFMRWYEYRLQFPAGEEIVNEVTAPIYPSVRGSGKNKQYDYTYLLSPARKWASFGSLRVELKTPYYLTESSLDFEKTDDGYALDWEDGLPLGELTFTLTQSEPAAAIGFQPFGGGIDTLSLVLIIFFAVLALAGIGVTVGLVVGRQRRAAAPRQGTTQEGKIDLPPDDGEGKIDLPPDDGDDKKQ